MNNFVEINKNARAEYLKRFGEAIYDSIAIVGYSCRFPGAKNAEEFWSNIANGKKSITFFEKHELDSNSVAPEEIDDPNYVAARGILGDVDQFDAEFFGFTPKEAQLTDPQHRLFLTLAQQALDHAGYTTEKSDSIFGLFGGAGANSYMLNNLASGFINGTGSTLQAYIHNKHDHLTTRAAYKLNLNGPCINVQTACSTSLVAVEQACQSLFNHQVDVAMAGACTIAIPENTGYLFQQDGIGSPDGHCRAFDKNAQGTVGGNGGGIVVLKRLEDALNDGDHIHAIIKGIGINNDGSQKVGYTAPSIDRQTEAIKMAHAMAGVSPETITYVEAHGTGTKVGDAVELKALSQAFNLPTSSHKHCAIGSVKPNIGHLDTASGIAGLIKTILCIKHKTLVPTVNFESETTEVDFDASPFYVNTELKHWDSKNDCRRAGISSFGLGGTNVHMVLEEFPELPQAKPSTSPQIMYFSANSRTSLEKLALRIKDHLEANSDTNLASVAYTLQTGRKRLKYRRMFVASSVSETIENLQTLNPEKVFSHQSIPEKTDLIFMFPGQGAQYVNMSRSLYNEQPEYKKIVDKCADILTPIIDRDIRTIIFADGNIDQANSLLSETQYTQPALFVVEYALAQYLMHLGLKPDQMIGHSVGEYVAACIANVFSLEDALYLIAHRGKLVQKQPPGMMLAVSIAGDKAEKYTSDTISLAAVNGPEQSVFAGEIEDIKQLQSELNGLGYFTRELKTSHAFHSHMMNSIIPDFVALFNSITVNPPTCPFMSNVTGRVIEIHEAMSPEYWAKHLSKTVLFNDGIKLLLKNPQVALVEVGPSDVLRTLVRWHPDKQVDQFMHSTLPSVQMIKKKQFKSDLEFLMTTLGHLTLLDIEPQWHKLHTDNETLKLPLPAYPFEPKRHWIDPIKTASHNNKARSLEKQKNINNWYYAPQWKELPVVQSQRQPEAKTYLVFCHNNDFCQTIREKLEIENVRTIFVVPAESFEQIDSANLNIVVSDTRHYSELFKRLYESGEKIDKIVHLLGVFGAPEDTLEHSFNSLSYIAEMVNRHLTADDEIKLLVISNETFDIFGYGGNDPRTRLVVGPIKTIPQEYPKLSARLVDIHIPPLKHQQLQVIELLTKEMLLEETVDVDIAIRNDKRWQCSFEPIAMNANIDTPLALKDGGCYLITGGLGGIGLRLAQKISCEKNVTLVLIHRSYFPEQEHWGQMLYSGSTSNVVCKKIESLTTIVNNGCHLVLHQGDVSDQPNMESLFSKLDRQYGGITGVFHTAGVAGGRLIQLTDLQKTQEVLVPKVAGTMVLGDLLTSRKPEFFVLFSSLTTVVPRIGQTDYTAANAFLDAFARHYGQSTGIKTTAINWGAWEDIGMAANSLKSAHQSEQSLYAVQPFAHPFLDRYVIKEDGTEIYSTDFNVKKHWILDEHRIFGNPVIPGISYFEMLRAIMEKRSDNAPITFENVVFINPVRVEDGDTRKVDITVTPKYDKVEFLVQSIEPDDNTYTLKTYVSGNVRVTKDIEVEKYNLEELTQRCSARTIHLAVEDREEDIGPRWHSVRQAHVGENEALFELKMQEAFHSDFEQLKFHPALLDRCCGLAKQFLVNDDYYIPLSYQILEMKGALPPNIFCYARFIPRENENHDTATFDVTLIDKDGNGLVEVRGFTQIRMSDPGRKIRNLTDDEMSSVNKLKNDKIVSVSKEGEWDGISPDEGMQALSQILSSNVGSQVVVSVRDLESTIEASFSAMQNRLNNLTAQNNEQKSIQVHPRPDLDTAYVEPKSDLDKAIAQIWQSMLGIDGIGINDNFFDLGGDSLTAVQIVSQIEQELKTKVPPFVIFDGGTIKQIVSFIEGETTSDKSTEQMSRGARRLEKLKNRSARS